MPTGLTPAEFSIIKVEAWLPDLDLAAGAVLFPSASANPSDSASGPRVSPAAKMTDKAQKSLQTPSHDQCAHIQSASVQSYYAQDANRLAALIESCGQRDLKKVNTLLAQDNKPPYAADASQSNASLLPSLVLQRTAEGKSALSQAIGNDQSRIVRRLQSRLSTARWRSPEDVKQILAFVADAKGEEKTILQTWAAKVNLNLPRTSQTKPTLAKVQP